jgi:hypothetical protein
VTFQRRHVQVSTRSNHDRLAPSVNGMMLHVDVGIEAAGQKGSLDIVGVLHDLRSGPGQRLEERRPTVRELLEHGERIG